VRECLKGANATRQKMLEEGLGFRV
jgi:hypothetical protein